MRTEPFRVSRLALAYLAVARYLETYWWFAAVIPAFGIVALIVGSGILRIMGLVAVLWPIGLPARAILATSRTGNLLQRGVWASLEDDVLYLHGKGGDGLKLPMASVRRVGRTRGFLVLVLARGDFVGLPLAALNKEFVDAIEAAPRFDSTHREGGAGAS